MSKKTLPSIANIFLMIYSQSLSECVDLVADTQTNTPKARLLSINSPTSQNLRPTTALPYQREKTFFHVLSRFKYLILGSHNLELASVQMNVLFNHQSDHNIVNPFWTNYRNKKIKLWLLINVKRFLWLLSHSYFFKDCQEFYINELAIWIKPQISDLNLNCKLLISIWPMFCSPLLHSMVNFNPMDPISLS